MMNTMNPTDHTGFYTETEAEREERMASLVGKWEPSDREIFDADEDDFDYRRELAYFSQNPNLIYM